MVTVFIQASSTLFILPRVTSTTSSIVLTLQVGVTFLKNIWRLGGKICQWPSSFLCEARKKKIGKDLLSFCRGSLKQADNFLGGIDDLKTPAPSSNPPAF